MKKLSFICQVHIFHAFETSESIFRTHVRLKVYFIEAIYIKTLNLEQVCYLIPIVCRSRYFMVSLPPFLTYEGKHSRTWNILLFQVPYE